jgi:ribosomal protein S18 acetylase RimI-like enzyme
MGLTYFKRYRMEIYLPGRDFSSPGIPVGYRFVPWDESLVGLHAETKYLCFRDEIDANVFPCLGEQAGCRRLMGEIAQKPGFLPQATWLLMFTDGIWRRREYVGTIQGIRDRAGMGAIQNLGVLPAHRGRGLGASLLLRSLEGFREAGLSRVPLEVTAENQGAIRLYRRLGFVTVKTVFKVAEVAYS